MKTDQFVLTLGVNEGYDHNNPATAPLAQAVAAWSAAAEAEYAKSELYTSATASPGKSIYRQEWKCPPGGEDVAVLIGTRNPEFTTDGPAWKEAVRRVAYAAGKALGQKVLYLTFTEVEFDYIKIG